MNTEDEYPLPKLTLLQTLGGYFGLSVWKEKPKYDEFAIYRDSLVDPYKFTFRQMIAKYIPCLS